ncbi:aromatic acid exporter family protein [Bacillus sp. 03113]|uniref:aromatic acid exporter family protein n=1 Tax=Bacillus sp. 03113 TaxID=2578211 RepID=UPI0011435501|nr:aromatic acid exporter family protein [Bacillus sp. 03113]
MKYKIGYRTFKSAAAVSLAIMLAQLCQLNFYVSSAIITILCVQNSKKKSLKSASSRFLACMLAIPASFIFFEGIGFHPIVIGLLLLFFIPTTVWLKINEGVVTSTVIILHIYSTNHVTWDVVFNEMGLIVIGIGSALLVNLYMPSLDKQLKVMQKQIEESFKSILLLIVEYLRTSEKKWEDHEIEATMKLLKTAKTLASRDVENHLTQSENYYYSYFSIREKQFEIIQRLLDIMTSIDSQLEQRYLVADFIEELSLCIHRGNTAKLFLSKLTVLEEEFKKTPLPKTWETFETEAQLYHLLWEMKKYLLLKQSLKLV